MERKCRLKVEVYFTNDIEGVPKGVERMPKGPSPTERYVPEGESSRRCDRAWYWKSRENGRAANK